ncbi:bifunctional riboflavin kinase/FAD synthetase [Sulfuriroseicoccus oceanibius]|uniref:Riboflavin biosynthesis protein n=1 Tax=Sulfuriroseicoccus oceanibius TaxID=2707525 RepID=A0A6B3LCH8_9BACT|nr:bifunctional riboflavin kinase/FAD synthetase [Sulfuriroseicoccus oceanibius]QQL44739.1 bifunctional riboflavin kinase/FAD synthetase [Sulfuriroseicoccus oceanibius]
MEILRSIADLTRVPGPVHLAIGVFDGVHIGHMAVIGDALAGAKASGGSAVVVTFDPHPIRVLAPEVAPRLLTAERHKEMLLEEMGVKWMLVIPFDGVFAKIPGDRFVRDLLSACENLRQIAVGTDFEFGAKRSGNVAMLESMGVDYGFSVSAVDQVTVGGERVSSTAIRHAVQVGDFAKAASLLGREYTVLGTVIQGRKLGRTLGFPTANLTVHSEQLPPNGVWAVKATLRGEVFNGVANLGVRPTVEGGAARKLLEVHLFDFEGDLYGAEMDVRFVKFLREETKFDSLEALTAQITADAEAARAVFGG